MNRKKNIEQLFRQHYAKMYNLARCILSDDDESKDVVSEVFAQILADDVVLVPGGEEGYLMRSVRNRCLNLIAHKSVKERVNLRDTQTLRESWKIRWNSARNISLKHKYPYSATLPIYIRRK
jgi:DNA-directed RNA polymerase specialized sigma24 family protein